MSRRFVPLFHVFRLEFLNDDQTEKENGTHRAVKTSARQLIPENRMVSIVYLKKVLCSL